MPGSEADLRTTLAPGLACPKAHCSNPLQLLSTLLRSGECAADAGRELSATTPGLGMLWPRACVPTGGDAHDVSRHASGADGDTARLRLRPRRGEDKLGKNDDSTVCVKPWGDGGGCRCSADRMWRAFSLRRRSLAVCASRWQQMARKRVGAPVAMPHAHDTAHAPLLPACRTSRWCCDGGQGQLGELTAVYVRSGTNATMCRSCNVTYCWTTPRDVVGYDAGNLLDASSIQCDRRFKNPAPCCPCRRSRAPHAHLKCAPAGYAAQKLPRS